MRKLALCIALFVALSVQPVWSEAAEIQISSTPGGQVLVPGEGTFSYPDGSTVNLAAIIMDPNYLFSGWSGSLVSAGLVEEPNNPITIFRAGADGTIQALFTRIGSSASDRTLHVDRSAIGPIYDGTPDHPFLSIQEAIQAAGPGNRVSVAPGTYVEQINFEGKHITVARAGGPGEPGPYPVIDGGGSGAVVTFDHGEDSRAQLTGFMITNGNDPLDGAGINCIASSPTIRNCIIAGNRGNGLFFLGSTATLSNCTITGNGGKGLGCGLFTFISPKLKVSNTLLWDNIPVDLKVAHGEWPELLFSNYGNGPLGPGSVRVDPLFARPGQWIHEADQSPATDPFLPDTVWVPGDYHLRSQTGRWNPETLTWSQDNTHSPVIDAGDPTDSADAEPLPNGALINMGGYGGTEQASQSL